VRPRKSKVVTARAKTIDFGTVFEAIRFPQNKRLTVAVSRGFSEQRTACDSLSLGDLIHFGSDSIAPCQRTRPALKSAVPRLPSLTRDGRFERFERCASHAEQTSTFLKVKHCAVSASQSAGLGDLRNAGESAYDHERPAEIARSIMAGNTSSARCRKY
jgi:hypothetical protein